MQPGDAPTTGTPPMSDGQPKTDQAPVATASDMAPAQSWYHPGETAPQSVPVAPEASQAPLMGPSVRWTASEFIAHEKSPMWYVSFIVVAGAVGALTYLLTREVFLVVVIILALAAFGAMAFRRPRTLEYRLDDHGIGIGPKLYAYSNFKSFSLGSIGAIHSIDLIPMHRFRPVITIYFAPEQEQEILNTLSAYLAFEEREMDTVERLMHRLHF